MNAHDLEQLLRERYSGQEWAFFAQVRNGTGYTKRVTRTADALALGLWPSRGMELHGFEIKCSRSDWKREVADPQKAEEIAAYCDRWWVVVSDPKIIHDGELPPAWGLLAAVDGKLATLREAEKRADAKPLDRSFVAAVLRAAAREADQHFARRVADAVDAGMAAERKAWDSERASTAETIERLRGDKIEIERRLRAVDLNGNRYRLEHLRDTARRILSDVEAALAEAPENTEAA